MNGQVKAVIPALIGIVPLLLAGITGYVNNSGGQQATAIASRSATAVTLGRGAATNTDSLDLRTLTHFTGGRRKLRAHWLARSAQDTVL